MVKNRYFEGWLVIKDLPLSVSVFISPVKTFCSCMEFLTLTYHEDQQGPLWQHLSVEM